MNSKANYILICLFLLITFGLGISTIIKKPDEVSISERRNLKSIPSLNLDDITSGKYFKNFDSFLLDQIPFRDKFRTLKSINLFYVFRQKDNHKIFIKDGYACQITYPLSDKKMNLLIKKVNYLNETYFKKSNVYSTIIPDKAYYLVKNSDYPLIDYKKLKEKAKNSLPNYIDIFDYLDISSYYKTDTHWKNNKISKVAKTLLDNMGMNSEITILNEKELSPFYGVLYGESAIPLNSESIAYLNTDKMNNISVYRIDKKTKKLTSGKLYYDEMIKENDPYDIFLGGASNITIIDNEKITDGKILYLFSDSFGRSLAPLLISDYDKIIFIDLRYMKMSNFAKEYEIKDNSDVLYAYSIQSIDVISNLQVD